MVIESFLRIYSLKEILKGAFYHCEKNWNNNIS